MEGDGANIVSCNMTHLVTVTLALYSCKTTNQFVDSHIIFVKKLYIAQN